MIKDRGALLHRDKRQAFFAASGADNSTVDLSTSIGSLLLASPVMPASGCFGPELSPLLPIGELGATVTKTVFASSRLGNAAPRVSEIPAGMVNSVGIPSLGPEWYLANLHAKYLDLGIPTIISVGGHRPQEFAEVVERLQGAGSAYEINVSCPNLDANGIEIGSDPNAIHDVVTRVRACTDLPLIVKLAPMVASISDCALAAEAAGADAVCVANSIPCLPIDPKVLTPLLGNEIGGLTGPAMRPVILRLVRQCAQHIKIPIIGCGGVVTASDALEYFAVGASSVQVGTATLSAPSAMAQIARDLRRLCEASNVASLEELIAHKRAVDAA